MKSARTTMSSAWIGATLGVVWASVASADVTFVATLHNDELPFIEDPPAQDEPAQVHPHLATLLLALDTPGLERLEYRGVDDTGSPLFTTPDTPQDGARSALLEAAGILTERSEATEQRVRQLLVRVNEGELGSAPRPGLGNIPVVDEIEGFTCVDRHAFESHVSYVVEVPAEGVVPGSVDRLRNAPGVTYIEPNYFSVPSTSRAPTPPTLTHPFPNDAAMLDTWWLLAIGAPQAWSRVQGDRDVVVAVLDSGIDKTHPDLTDRIVGGMSYFSDEDPEPLDDWGHGTHCAGIIGATGNNDFGSTGVCWRVSLLPQRIMRSKGDRLSSSVRWHEPARFVTPWTRARASSASVGVCGPSPPRCPTRSPTRRSVMSSLSRRFRIAAATAIGRETCPIRRRTHTPTSFV
jgi:subtilisin family serine protease